MNDPLYHQLCELSWRHKLTDAQEARLRFFLAAHPDAQADWEGEKGLNQLLEKLSDVPISSNFTNRVLRALEGETAGQSWAHTPWRRFLCWHAFGWLPKTAVATVLLCAALLGYQHHRVARRAQIAQSLPRVSSVISLSSPEVWENFNTINQLSRTPPQPDRELLALLK
jgi:hypothetical protein